MLKIFLYGYYGAKNFGDELLLYKIVSDINSRVSKEKTFYVWTIDETYTRSFLKKYFPDIKLVCVNMFDPRQTVESIKECDVVVLGGGGIVQEYYEIQIDRLFAEFGRHIPSYATPFLIARILGKKTFAWSIGHGRVGTREGVEFSRWFYSMADIITTRDYQSYLDITGLLGTSDNIYPDIDPLLDPDFSFDDFLDKNIQKSGFNIGISVRSWFNNSQMLRSFCDAVKVFKDRHPSYNFNFIPADPNLDSELLQQIKSCLGDGGNIKLLDINDPFDTVRQLASQDYTVCMRLHTMITAYKLGIPSVFISYDNKTKQFLEQLGADYIDVYSLSGKTLLEKLFNMVEKKQEYPAVNFDYRTPGIFADFVDGKNTKTQITPQPEGFSFHVEDNLVKSLLAHRSELQQKLEQITVHSTALQREVQDLAERNSQLQQENTVLQREVQDLAERNSQLQQENAALQREVQELAERNSQLQQENTALHQNYMDIQNKFSQLNSEFWYYKNSLDMIYSSDFWKVAKFYYRVRDNNRLIRYIHDFMKFLKKKLFSKRNNINGNVPVDLKHTEHETNQNIEQNTVVYSGESKPLDHKGDLILRFENSERICVIISGIKFEEILNQRPLNLAKELSKAGYTVFFVVFQWSRDEEIENSYSEVYTNIFQIPLYGFIDMLDIVENRPLNKSMVKKAVITFPHSNFVDIYSRLRKMGFKIIYDIMDDWQAFYDVGQASWYIKDIEEKMILESDIVLAVNDFIIKKFENLRGDIHLVPNGYSLDVVGKDKKFTGGSGVDKNIIRIGYVGWLTESRFNWDFVINLSKLDNVLIELVGYGIPEDREYNLPDNVKYIGKVHPKELYNYFLNWNAVMIPFIDHHISKGADPIKVYQYIYYGLPVLCTNMEHLSSYPLVYNVSSVEEAANFLELVKDPESIRKLREENLPVIERFLEESLWSNRFKIIISENTKRSLWEI